MMDRPDRDARDTVRIEHHDGDTVVVMGTTALAFRSALLRLQQTGARGELLLLDALTGTVMIRQSLDGGEPPSGVQSSRRSTADSPRGH